mmetsp:Transcript_3148/g.5172  ORF Transcript_3148/g.5172 Transcript_3148/m.5172 type:complete len:301 (+) Transcript_3148:1358-2260(+)
MARESLDAKAMIEMTSASLKIIPAKETLIEKPFRTKCEIPPRTVQLLSEEPPRPHCIAASFAIIMGLSATMVVFSHIMNTVLFSGVAASNASLNASQSLKQGPSGTGGGNGVVVALLSRAKHVVASNGRHNTAVPNPSQGSRPPVFVLLAPKFRSEKACAKSVSMSLAPYRFSVKQDSEIVTSAFLALIISRSARFESNTTLERSSDTPDDTKMPSLPVFESKTHWSQTKLTCKEPSRNKRSGKISSSLSFSGSSAGLPESTVGTKSMFSSQTAALPRLSIHWQSSNTTDEGIDKLAKID